MCENVNDNPFAGLFASIFDVLSFASNGQKEIVEKVATNDVENDAESTVDNDAENEPKNDAENAKDGRTAVQTTESPSKDEQVNRLLEDVFGIRLRAEGTDELKKRLVLVEADTIELALFERLTLQDPESNLVPKKHRDLPCDPHAVETRTIFYLFESYCRLQHYAKNNESQHLVSGIRHAILQNTCTALLVPDLFQEQEIREDFARLFKDKIALEPELRSFTVGVVEELELGGNENGEDLVASSFGPILDIIRGEAERSNLIFQQYWFSILCVFASIEPLAKLVIAHSAPKSNRGRAYADTLLGALFSLSCLPKSREATFDFFDKPFQQRRGTMERHVWAALDLLSEALHKVFHLLLTCSVEVRHLTLEWLGKCIDANAKRGKLWTTENDLLVAGAANCVSDGFMLNLGNVLLRLCQPFCVRKNESKIPKIDPTYCAVELKDETEEERLARGVHLRGLSTETCLIPTTEGAARPVAQKFGFTTECFFLTHRALDLGYRVVLDKLLRTDQDLAVTQRVHSDAQSDGMSDMLEAITELMETQMTKYLSLEASLLAPESLKFLARFHATTAFWLVQVYLDDGNSEEGGRIDYVPKEYKPVTFPLPDTVPDTIRCIPEFVVENTIRFLCFLRASSTSTFEEQGPSFLNPILTEIIVLMESERRLHNPHLRARLAEALGALLPGNHVYNPLYDLYPSMADSSNSHRKELFVTHPHRQRVVENLLRVFVSIEMTGQSVQFEQKFNYRRPMYDVMEYLWALPEHRNIFTRLAQEAEANMEAANPPLFLRFVNLLINDAVFLLDDALSNMAQIRQMLRARENGEWNELPQRERDQQAGHFEYVRMAARFDNVLGRKTMDTLKMLTSEIKSIFCHPTMVDRIASMLNYFLLQLVGPNKKNLKVNDQESYGFMPTYFLLTIRQIYVNLSDSESFTLAVSQDGRSYSPELFKLADDILVRVGEPGELGFSEFAKSVEAAATLKREEDEILVDAPEEFLDPIMSTLMKDPVILPSSRVNIDRQTIARHLLSDQTDPFNRSPLTMDMVKPNDELRRKITEWIQKKKEEKAAAFVVTNDHTAL